MSEKKNDSGPTLRERDPRTGRKSKRQNGAGPGRGDDRPLPGISIRELVEERNWTALAGLGLMALGVLYLLQDLFGFNLNLWSLLLLGIGGVMLYDAWDRFDQAGQRWTEDIRNRVLAGGLIALVGLMSLYEFNLWALFPLVIGLWLAHDTWQRYQAQGRTWTPPIRNRMLVAGFLVVIGGFSFFSLGSTWPLLLIGIGAVMLYRHLAAD
jgi:hypothetical protein